SGGARRSEGADGPRRGWRRGSISVGSGRSAGRSGLYRIQDRSRWIQLPAHIQRSILTLVQREPRAFADACVPVEKVRVLARERRQHVAAFRLLLDEHPAGVRPRAMKSLKPDVAVAF